MYIHKIGYFKCVNKTKIGYFKCVNFVFFKS